MVVGAGGGERAAAGGDGKPGLSPGGAPVSLTFNIYPEPAPRPPRPLVQGPSISRLSSVAAFPLASLFRPRPSIHPARSSRSCSKCQPDPAPPLLQTLRSPPLQQKPQVLPAAPSPGSLAPATILSLTLL